MQERLQKTIARAGVSSRRAAEELIRAGRVTVNGARAELGSSADPTTDIIAVDGNPVPRAGVQRYYLLHKPAGYVVTRSDPQGRPTIFELLPSIPGLISVGRLDIETEGLLLLTTDGDWAERLAHPRYNIEREYEVYVRGPADPEAVERLREGTLIEGRPARPTAAFESGRENFSSILTVVMVEGRRREVRLLCASAGLPIRRLIRRRFGTLRLGWLTPGQWRELDTREVESVFNARSTRPVTRPAAEQGPTQRVTQARKKDNAGRWSGNPNRRGRPGGLG